MKTVCLIEKYVKTCCIISRFSKRVDENKGNYLQGIEKRVRDAVREEMVQLMSDGVLKSQPGAKPIKLEPKLGSGNTTTPSKRGVLFLLSASAVPSNSIF
jgi:hypothetical protein